MFYSLLCFFILPKMAKYLVEIGVGLFIAILFGAWACDETWDCSLCIQNNCRYFKNKAGYFCVARILPPMKPRFVYMKNDCLSNLIKFNLLYCIFASTFRV